MARCALELARRFERGGTLWCVAPGWTDHARHLAVEFVHPVIVGKRALPAMALSGPDTATVLRTCSRPADALIVLEPEETPLSQDLFTRARRWGLLTIWLGSGAPPAGADHVLRIDAPFGLYGREAVMSYHLLWELTHVCLEHPGLVVEACDPGQVCVTCSDEGRPAEIVSCDGDRALVRSALGTEQVDISLVQPATPGSAVLIHAGVAVTALASGTTC